MTCDSRNLKHALAFVSDTEFSREVAHEQLMIDRGKERAERRNQRERERGNGSATPGAKSLLQGMSRAFTEIIEEEIERLSAGSVKRKPPELRSLQLLPAQDYAVIALRSVLDTLASFATQGPPTAQRLGFSIGGAVASEVQARAFYETEKPLFEAVVRKVSARTSSPEHRIKELLVSYKSTCEGAGDPLTHTEKVRLGVYLLSAMETLGVVKAFTETYRNRTTRTYGLSDEAWQTIGKVDAAAAEMRPWLQPTVVPPMRWTDSRTGGYWLPMKGTRLVAARNRSNGAGRLSEADAPLMFDALNYLQAIPHRINRRVLAVVERMRESGISCDSLPSFELETVPPRPADINTNEDARKAYRSAARGVYTRNATRRGQLLAADRAINVARDLRDEPVIYFPKMIDFRGRVYDLPQFLKPQGDDLSKGLLEFGNAKPLGADGAHWLAIHVANTWGEDKVSFDERKAWVAANEDRILRAAADPFAERMWMDADSPFCFLAACFEYEGFIREGNAHLSRIAIALDGSCNGLQHLSAILRDATGGAAVNLLPSKQPKDIYTEVLRKVVDELMVRAAGGEPTAQRWLPLMKRSVVKRPVMTLPYGATLQGFADQIMEDTLRPLEKEGNSPFSQDAFEACRYLGDIVWQATSETVVAARQVMDWLQEVAKIAGKVGTPLSWETPTGFRVTQKYMEPQLTQIELRASGQRVRLWVAEGHTSKMDKSKMARAISPNFVHALDAAHMLRTVAQLLDTVGPDIHLTMIHDSYGTHACDAGHLSTALRQAFIQMYQERDWLESFRDEVQAQLGEDCELPPLPEKGTLHLSDVIDSAYFFA